MRPPRRLARLRHLAHSKQGIALPLALLSLVAVSLMLSSALVTSSTEVALSAAHQEGTRALYHAESAVERFAAERAAAATVPQLVGGTYTRSAAPDVEVRITAAELGRHRVRLPNGMVRRREVFALLAQPQGGRGRSTGALLTVVREAVPPGENIRAAMMAGADRVQLPGSSFTLTGADTSSCLGGVVPGLTLALGTQAGNVREGTIIGGVRQDQVSREDYGRFALNGRTPEQLAAAAEIRWGSLAGGRPIASTTFSASGSNSVESGLNWGCPAGLSLGCLLDADTSYLPLVAIKPAVSQSIKLQGVGQGYLLVLGDAELNSDFFYRGVVLVTGDLTVNGGARVLGSLIALSDVTLESAVDRDTDADEARVNGGAEIRYDRCGIDRASDSLLDRLLDVAPQQFRDRTWGWFEVHR